MEMAYELLTVAIAALAAVTVVTLAALRGWQGWLALKLRELERTSQPAPAAMEPGSSPAARIELADLKERVRQLEAIASGVDL